MNYRDFYSEVGKLLYAIAKADGHIQKHEFEKLREVVTNVLVPAEMHKDAHGTDTAWYAEIEFDYLEENLSDPQAAFESFVSYVEKHKTAITPELRDRIYVCARELAKAYRGITSSESTVLINLWDEMTRIFKNQTI
ncbi:MAG: hypothetical protein ACHQF2_06780 [Flavobacteriales bacterium]